MQSAELQLVTRMILKILHLKYVYIIYRANLLTSPLQNYTKLWLSNLLPPKLFFFQHSPL